ncbi:Rossmann-fold NAD(P)-binding domain-containing protein, partial [Vibrio parahaemolyticus]
SIDSLCKVIAHVILHWKSGIYNLGSKNGMSKENFVLQFLEQCGIHNISYESVSIKDSNIKVIRPKDMRMDVELFES